MFYLNVVGYKVHLICFRITFLTAFYLNVVGYKETSREN